jgi:hypothetical protein
VQTGNPGILAFALAVILWWPEKNSEMNIQSAAISLRLKSQV